MVDSNSKEQFLHNDVLINILKRVPVKSLIRFKSVSKEWLNIIESSHFTQQHLHYTAHTNTFLLLQRIPRQPPPLPFSCCLIGPHNTNVAVHQFSDIASPTARIVSSFNGLLCFRDRTSVSLVNPATKQTKHVPGTTLFGFHYVGFGFTPVSNDYKLVRVSMCAFDDVDQVVVLDDVRVDRADVYSLATGCWREIDATNLRPLCLVSSSVAITGTVFWLATLISDSDTDTDTDSEFVVSFDVEREFFALLNCPPLPASSSNSCSNVLAVCDDKLAMFRHYIFGNLDSCSFDLWVLEENGVHTRESWVKMYSVGPLSTILYPMSIWRDEVVCRAEVSRHGSDDYRRVETVLSLFNPFRNELKNLPAAHRDEFCYVPFPYAESLVSVSNIPHGGQ